MQQIPSSFTVCACKLISLKIHFNNQTESANPAFISTCCNLAQKKAHYSWNISYFKSSQFCYTLFF